MWATSPVFSLCMKLLRSPASGTSWRSAGMVFLTWLFSVTVKRIQAGRKSLGVPSVELAWVCVDSVYPRSASLVHLCRIYFYGWCEVLLGTFIGEICQQWLLKMPGCFSSLKAWTCSSCSSSGDVLGFFNTQIFFSAWLWHPCMVFEENACISVSVKEWIHRWFCKWGTTWTWEVHICQRSSVRWWMGL